ncbi:hypothetical protein [Rhodococcus sp. KRD162]|uniref:hypothetical protein n=1 Tax=Rhodococcus sp. KRD162 TaxID=2729725 RepID=UPI0019D1C755|nr:hypothetical protein [Rhodococcus sp. KRD162]
MPGPPAGGAGGVAPSPGAGGVAASADVGVVDPSVASGAVSVLGVSNPPPPSVRCSDEDEATVDTAGDVSGPVAAKTAEATSAPTARPAAAVATSGTRPFHRFRSFDPGATASSFGPSSGFGTAGIGWV